MSSILVVFNPPKQGPTSNQNSRVIEVSGTHIYADVFCRITMVPHRGV